MNNKETLQKYNDRLDVNNTSLSDILSVVDELPTITEPNLQDKSIEIRENGTQTVRADEGYDGLNQVNVTVDGIENITAELTTYNTELEEQETTLDDLVEVLKTKGAGEIPKYAPDYISFRDFTGTELNDETANLDTSKVTNMSNMFNNCQQVITLDLSNWNTNNVTDMNKMFYYCKKLITLNLSNFDTSNVTNMSNMFSSCQRASTLDLSGFNTSKATNMNSMFYGCSALTSLDLSNFNTSNVTNMSYMFSNCQQATSLDLSSFDTSKVTDMSYMFSGCRQLQHLDIRGFTFDNVTTYTSMFSSVLASCEIIVKDDTAKTWITSKYTTLTNVKTVAELEV